ncbi:MAG: NAD+ synthase [Parachlamydiales bacterium]|jgi:NAD+ synthase (glutamine-hydrolysing)
MIIYVAQLNPKVGDLSNNTDKIIKSIHEARSKKAKIVIFPEGAICGYPPEDLLLHHDFVEQIGFQLERIIKESKDLFIVVGTIRKNNDKKGKPLFNSAAVIHNQKLLGFKDKTLLPTYDVFDERRYFEPGEKQKVFEFEGKKIGVLICEDAWAHANYQYSTYDNDPVVELEKLKPDFVINISASPYHFRKNDLRIDLFSKVAKTFKKPVIMCNQVGANDQLVFDGYSFYLSPNGELLSLAKGFEEDQMIIDTNCNYNVFKYEIDPMQELYEALILGVRDYFKKQNLKKALVGLSGGIDSALVLAIAADALGKDNVMAISMPSRFSSLSSMEDAHLLCSNLNVKLLDIPIDHLYQEYLNLLCPVFEKRPFDSTEENLQARIRGMILMGISNKLGYIVLSTGNKSELAMGYVTLYGDMCGGLGVLNDVSKTLIYSLVKWMNANKEIIPVSIINKEPSAELRPNQKDEDFLPKYSILDKILESYVEDNLTALEIVKKYNFEPDLVKDVIKKIHSAEYKRRQGPPGIKVSKIAFTKGRYFPIVQGWIK